MPLLEIDNVHKSFGGISALDGVSLDAERGEIVGLIGPNGAGKTTVFNVITRISAPDRGDVRFDGESLLRLRPNRIIARGIARTFQDVELFSGLTVYENVQIGAGTRRGDRPIAEVLDYVGTSSRRDSVVDDLPFGVQKRVELARALASSPRLLLLDEPAGGLAHSEVEELGAFLRRLRDDFELTVLVVEHHMGLVMAIADRVHVLDFGRRIASGTPREVQSNPAVVNAYLGTTAA